MKVADHENDAVHEVLEERLPTDTVDLALDEPVASANKDSQHSALTLQRDRKREKSDRLDSHDLCEVLHESCLEAIVFGMVLE